MTEQFVIKTAEKAGFVFNAGSDINNNSLDAKDHKNGFGHYFPSNEACPTKKKVSTRR